MRAFLESRGGRAGFALLSILVLVGIFGPLFLPYHGAAERWRDLGFWQDSPAAAPPLWFQAPWSQKRATSGRLEPREIRDEVMAKGGTRLIFTFTLPSRGRGLGVGGSFVLLVRGAGALPLLVSARDAEGGEKELLRRLVETRSGEIARLPLAAEAATEILVSTYLLPGAERPPAPSLVIVGQVSGLLGTDVGKRDIFTGLVLGLRWALLLGVGVSFLTVMTGILLALGAACSGGWVDRLINRVYEFFSLIPILPLLIVLSAVYKPGLWNFAGLALLFFWTRAFKPIYALALQIRGEGYIEAARASGAGILRRALVHVLPALLPYGFAVMALSVPGIILYEASISLLGLGDPKVVTWGQMLHDALVQGAVINRLWWWVLPPGLMIALTALTFALLGRGFERLWNPRREGRIARAK